MSTLATLVIKLRADIGDFVKGIDDAERRTAQLARQATRTGRAMTEGLTLPLVAAGALFFKFAADAEVTERRFELAFGGMAGQARAFSESLGHDLGLSAEGIRQAMIPAEQSLRAMGFAAQGATQMSEGLVKLAEDLSVTSGAGQSVDEIMQKLTRGLMGSARGVRDLGIVISPAVVQAYALHHGLLGLHQELSTGNRAWITYQMYFEQTKNLHGAFAQNLNGPLVMLRQLTEGLQDVARAGGTSLMGAFKAIIGEAKKLAAGIKEAVDWFAKLPQGWRNIIVYAGAAVAAIGPLIWAFGKVVSGITGLIAILGLLKVAFVFMLTNPVGQVIGLLGLLTVAVVRLADYWNWMKEQAFLAWMTVADIAQRGAAALLNAMASVFDSMGPLGTGFAAVSRAAATAITESNAHLFDTTAAQLARMEALFDASGRNIHRTLVHALTVPPSGKDKPEPDKTKPPGGNINTVLTQAQRIAEALRLMDEQLASSRMEAQLLGLSFNEPAARAQELQKAFRAIAEAGATADQSLNAHGLTLRRLGLAYQSALDSARRFADMTQTLSSSVAGGIGRMAAALGASITGGGKFFKQLGDMLLSSLGAVAAAIGQRLIEMGVLLKLALTWNPFTMIAAGLALVALGGALGSVATNAYAQGGGGGGGGGVSASSGSSGGSGGSTQQIVMIQIVGQDGRELSRRVVTDTARFEDLGGHATTSTRVRRVPLEGVVVVGR